MRGGIIFSPAGWFNERDFVTLIRKMGSSRIQNSRAVYLKKSVLLTHNCDTCYWSIDKLYYLVFDNI